MMRTMLRQIGNEHAVVIPNHVLDQVGISEEIEMSIERDAIILRRPDRVPRQGWAEDAKALVDAGEGGLVWPEFTNIGDNELA